MGGLSSGDSYNVLRSVFSATGTGGTIESTSTSFTHTGKASVWVLFGTDTDDKLCLGYNNIQFNNGHAFINYAASSFVLPQTDGLFTLTDAEDLNGKHAFLFGMLQDGSAVLYGFKDATSVTAVKGIPIVGGEAKIPVYSLSTEPGTIQYSGYSGSDPIPALVIAIQQSENWDWTGGLPANYAGLAYTSVTFSDGKASAAYDEDKVVGDL
jgi:hypothetical protein